MIAPTPVIDERRALAFRQERLMRPPEWRHNDAIDPSLVDTASVHCGAPERLTGLRLSQLGEEGGSLYEAAQFFMSTIRNGLQASHEQKAGALLVGATSTGKTTLSVAAMRSAILRSYTCQFVSYERFAQLHKDEMNLQQNAARYDDFVDRMDKIADELWRRREVYEVLVLDDMYRTDQPKIFREKLHELIRYRFDAGVFTIITSNTSPKDIKEMDHRFFDFLTREYQIFSFTTADKVA